MFTVYFKSVPTEVRTTVKAVSMALMVSASWPAMTAWAQTAPAKQVSEEELVNYDIPAGLLGPAISRFGAVSNLQLLYQADLVRDKETSGISGSMTSVQALEQLLAKSGLVFRFTAVNSVTIVDPADAEATSATEDNVVKLDTITVSGRAIGRDKSKNWIYESPTSTSVITRDEIQGKQARNISDIFDEVAGTYVADDPQSPGVNVNLRGLQDQNRVNMMIDGVRQTFQRSGHGATASAYIDPAMIRAVEINKNTTTGVGGAASLGGSVNFRTIIADDIIQPGNTFGSELNLANGTNEYDLAGAVSGAVRITDNFSVLASASLKKLGEYEMGNNGSVEDYNGTLIGSAIFTGSDEKSGLLKAKLRLNDDMVIEGSWLGYQGEYSLGTETYTNEEKLTNHTFKLNYAWSPENSLINLKADIWLNDVKSEDARQARTSYDAFDVEYSMASFGGSLENTSEFQLPWGGLSLNYGVEAFRDSANTVSVATDDTDDPENLWFAGPTPSGKRNVVSGFSTATFDHDDWLTVTGGLRYDHYKVTGTSRIFAGQTEIVSVSSTCINFTTGPVTGCTKAEYEAQQAIYFFFPSDPWPAGRPVNGLYQDVSTHVGWEQHYDDIEVETSGGSFLPAASIAVKPFKGVQFFTSYSEGYRPPTIMESVLGGQHIGGIGDFGPNPFLKEETSYTWEIGVNLSLDDLTDADDSLRLKGVLFNRSIDDYIMLGKVDIETSLGTKETVGYVNVDGTTKMQGAELEANYDAGFAYMGASYTYIETDYQQSYTRNGTSSIATEQLLVFAPPKMKFSIDAGMRLVDETLTLGGRVTHVADSEYLGGAASQAELNAYTTFDLYGSYVISENARLGVTINNVADLAYVSALGNPNYPAPGRTAVMSLNVKF